MPVPARPLDDARGVVRLAADATIGVTDVVEAMHARIGLRAWRAPGGRRRGISGVVYRAIRSVARAVGGVSRAAVVPVDAHLARAEAVALAQSPSPRREALVAALNGVVGDRLAADGSPLAIQMGLRRDGQSLDLADLAAAIPGARADVVVLVHGLCMNDLQWRYGGHHHGRALERDTDVTVVELHYNTGRHIADTGREFSAHLERLVAGWPVPVRSLTLLGHSMGGLVSRSAVEAARAEGHAWPGVLRRMVFLGTPHHGSPVERGGNAIDRLLAATALTAPLARVGQIRSAGVTDLRHGSVVDAVEPDRFARADPPTWVPLPAGVEAFAAAATPGRRPGSQRIDGLVPVRSALGLHPDPARCLDLPENARRVLPGLHHFDLLGPGAYPTLLGWLAARPSPVPSTGLELARPSRGKGSGAG